MHGRKIPRTEEAPQRAGGTGTVANTGLEELAVPPGRVEEPSGKAERGIAAVMGPS